MFSKKFVISTLKSISVLTLVIALSQSAAAQAQQPYFILDNDMKATPLSAGRTDPSPSTLISLLGGRMLCHKCTTM